jgi:single-stranded DNA-binding protein
MNLVAVIGEVASAVEAGDEGTVRFAVAVAGREESPDRLTVQATGGQAAACARYLRPGHRVAVEGRVAPRARPAEILAQRIQFLTTRAEARSLERPAA